MVPCTARNIYHIIMLLVRPVKKTMSCVAKSNVRFWDFDPHDIVAGLASKSRSWPINKREGRRRRKRKGKGEESETCGLRVPKTRFGFTCSSFIGSSTNMKESRQSRSWPVSFSEHVVHKSRSPPPFPSIFFFFPPFSLQNKRFVSKTSLSQRLDIPHKGGGGGGSQLNFG